MLPMRTAPAVWLLDGPVMTGPSTSNNRITDTSLIKWYRMSIADLPRDCKARAEKEENVKNSNTSLLNLYVYRGKCLKNAERGWRQTVSGMARKR